jgi:hypothetical protein
MEITNYKMNPKPSVLKASFTLKLTKEDLEVMGPLLIDCNFFEKDNGEYWINYAGKEYTSKEGKKKNWNMCRFESANMPETNKRIKSLFHPTQTPTSDELPF